MKQTQLISIADKMLKELQVQIAALNQKILRAPLIQSKVFSLPVIPPEDTHKPASYIAVDTIKDPELARTLACRAFAQIEAPPNHSTKAVYRLPGVMVINPSKQNDLIELVKTINELKRSLDDFGKDHELTANSRFQLFTKNHPRLVQKQVTRSLIMIASPLQSVTFTWGRRPMSHQISKKEVKDRLESMRSWHPNEVIDGIPWSTAIDNEISKIAGIKDDQPLRVRRMLKLHPLVNLRYRTINEKTGKPATAQYLAHTPVIVLSPTPIRIGQLRDFDPNTPKNKRPRLLSKDPISKFLALYEKRRDPPKS